MADLTATTGKAGKPFEDKRRMGWFSARYRLPLVFVAIAMVAISAMFVNFNSEVTRMGAAAPSGKADGIVVLTGDRERIAYALELLQQGLADRLLISGVHEKTSSRAIRRVTGAEPGLFDCCVDIDRLAMDTVGNAEQARSWARKHDFRSIIIVTSDYHMPRSMMEFARKLPEARIMPASVKTVWHESDTVRIGRKFQLMGAEFLKYLVARLRLGIREKENRSAIASAFAL